LILGTRRNPFEENPANKAPAAPTGRSVVLSWPDALSISWNPVSGAKTCRLYKDTNKARDFDTKVCSWSGVSYEEDFPSVPLDALFEQMERLCLRGAP
jgi:hypothetical protein